MEKTSAPQQASGGGAQRLRCRGTPNAEAFLQRKRCAPPSLTHYNAPRQSERKLPGRVRTTMIKALLLIFEPFATWERIWRARRGLPFILLIHLLPIVILTSAAEGYGLYHWGKARQFGPRRFYSIGEAIIFETAQFLLFLAVVFIGAKLIKSIGETFHGRHTFTQAFGTVAYGLSPLFLLHLLDALKDVSLWVPWSVGILLSIAALYQGVPRMMEPDPSHAFGLYLMGSLLLLLTSGLARFVTAWYLEGKFTGLESFISKLAERLPVQ